MGSATIERPRAGRAARLSADGRAGLASLGWTGLAQIAGLVIRLASNILLARLLAPDAYGLLGSALAVLTTLEWLADLGIQPALVRHPRGMEESFLRTGWTLGLVRGAAITGAGLLCAGPVAAFSRQPALFGILAGLSLRPALFSLRSPAMPTLRKTLNYRALFADEVAQTAVGSAVSVALAWLTGSIWAIVAGTLAGAVTGVIVSYGIAPARPVPEWDRQAAREIGHLGRQVLVNTLVMALWLNMDRLFGLRYLPLAAMGVYAVAWNLASVLETLVTRACDVYFSMLARRGDSHQHDWHRTICRRAVIVGAPLGAVAVAISPRIIHLLYDRRYGAAGPLFAVMVARLMVRSLGQVQFQYLLARAEVHLATKAYGVALAVQAGLFCGLVPRLGTMGLALAALGSTSALTLVQTLLLARRTGWGLAGFVLTAAGMGAGLAVVFFSYY